MATTIPNEAIHRAMLDGINSHLRAALKERFEEAAKPVIEDAIKGAMETFEVAVRQAFEVQNMREFVEVVLTDRRTKD